jgi:hypothetical protein
MLKNGSDANEGNRRGKERLYINPKRRFGTKIVVISVSLLLLNTIGFRLTTNSTLQVILNGLGLIGLIMLIVGAVLMHEWGDPK